MEIDRERLLQTPINSLIGEGASFKGEFSLTGSLRIDGYFSGKILSEAKVIIGEKGYVQTNIEARLVIVSGRVEGNIYATEVVHLMKSAKVYGDINSVNLLMDEGAIFEGRVKVHHS